MTELWRQVVARLRRRSLDRDLDEELQFHLDMKERDTGDRAAAQRALGPQILLRERAQDAWGWRWLDDAWWDIRYALRMWRQNPGFTVAAVTMLAIGIGVNAAVFTVTDAVLFEGFPRVRNDRLLYLRTQDAHHPRWYGYGVSYPDFQDWRNQAKTLAGMAACGGRPITLSDAHGLPERYFEAHVSANAFGLVDQRPILGRDFASSDERAGAPPVVILSHRLWRVRYGEDPAIVGRIVHVNGTPTTVIGVMPEGFTFPSASALWAPLVPDAKLLERDARGIFMIAGQLADGETIQNARAELDAIGRNIARANPATNKKFAPLVLDFNAIWNGPHRAMIYESMWVAVGFLLLIACANLANLLLARAIGRSREMSVRIALGAGRSRIVRQILVESLLLSIVGGACGWWLAGMCVRIYALAAFPVWGTPFDFSVQGLVVWYLIATSLGAGLLFGLAPALRLANLEVNAALKDGSPGATRGRTGRRLSDALVSVEMALTVVLLSGAGVMVHSVLRMYAADLGVDASRVLVTSLPRAASPDRDAQASLRDHIEARVTGMSDVGAVAFASNLPASGYEELPYEIDGTPLVDVTRMPTVPALLVSPEYFQTLRVAVRLGRAFTQLDGPSAPLVVVVNQRFATDHWPGESPVGQHLRIVAGSRPEGWRTVVGVVGNVVQRGLSANAANPWGGGSDPVVYFPYRQQPAGWSPTFTDVLVRPRAPSASIAMGVRREIQRADPDLPITVTPLSDLVRDTYKESAIDTAVILIFATVALLLAAIGLSAVIAHSVSQRTKEFGIRIAIGAGRRDIFALIVRQGLLPVGVGLITGWLASFGVTRLLTSLLVGVSPSDPLTFVIAPTVLMLAAAIGFLVPARRATRVDPIAALRHE